MRIEEVKKIAGMSDKAFTAWKNAYLGMSGDNVESILSAAFLAIKDKDAEIRNLRKRLNTVKSREFKVEAIREKYGIGSDGKTTAKTLKVLNESILSLSDNIAKEIIYG